MSQILYFLKVTLNLKFFESYYKSQNLAFLSAIKNSRKISKHVGENKKVVLQRLK